MTIANTEVKTTRIQDMIETWVRLGFKTQQVPYKPEWANGTGYFDHAVKDYDLNKEISDDTLIWSMDECGRHILIAPTLVGNVVVFDHGLRGTVVANVPDALRMAMPSGNWSKDDLDHWFSVPGQLPGVWVESFCKSMSVHLLRQARTAEKANEK